MAGTVSDPSGSRERGSDPSARGGGSRHRVIEARVVLAVAVRPRLWGAACRLALRIAAPGWWRRWPPRPTPPAAYVAFRAHTALGGAPGEVLSAADVVSYLEWCQRMERTRRRR